MIVFDSVCKQYIGETQRTDVLSNVSFTIKPGERIGVLGRNGAGKSTLIRMAAGVEYPTAGSVRRYMTCSWPLGFGGAFQSSLSGNDNIRFIARIYGEDFLTLKEKVEEFSELGRYLREPVRTYSSGMRARFGFGLSLGIDFECLLIDEIIAVGDERFKTKCHEAIISRSSRAMLFASHDAVSLSQYCNQFIVVKSGAVIRCKDMNEAFTIAHHQN